MIEWWIPLLIIFGGAMFLLLKGIPVAFAFVIVNMLGVLILQGGGAAFNTFTASMYASVTSFTLLPITLFILMGEILWHSKVAFPAGSAF